MRFIFIIPLLILATELPAQHLMGIWRGRRTQLEGGCFREYSLELHINNPDEAFNGKAYNYYNKEQFTKINFTGRYNHNTKRMVIIEGAVLQYNVPSNCVPCIKTYDLTWSVNGNDEVLTGEWKGHEMNNQTACPPGKIYLTRQHSSIFDVEVDQPENLAVIQKNITIRPRENELVQNLILDTPVIKIQLYDNAEIDDDTVSVFLNNKLLLYKKRLTAAPLSLLINAFPGTSYDLMMYAENLGRIPPNTALMVITAGTQRYELRISSDEKKNAVVRFRLNDPVSHQSP